MIKQFPRFAVPPRQQGKRWSRTRGALGGDGVWQRWIDCPMAIIGTGRSGSLLAEALSRSGVRRLTLIDPDIIEPHNLAEMSLVIESDVGKPKSRAIAERLRSMNSGWSEIDARVCDLTDQSARQAIAAHPLIWQCVDNGAARIAGGMLAAAYHRVLIDIATGVHMDSQRRMGADLRLILPGEGCILCFGGVHNRREALETLLSGTPQAHADWTAQRAGSLRSLNLIAVGFALRLAEDLVAERVTGSTWLHLEFDEHGSANLEYPSVSPSTDCLLCQRAGSGDEFFLWQD
ncbi:MAG: ThiF family adenylyltransferase [Methylococcales bacterium]